MPVPQKVALRKKLKTDLANVRGQIGCLGKHCELPLVNAPASPMKEEHMLSTRAYSSDKYQHLAGRKRKSAELSNQLKKAGHASHDDKGLITVKYEAISTRTVAFAKDSFVCFEGHNEKGQKMDATRLKQCHTVLMVLMNHQFGWVFNQPVDPVKLNIPDYFSIIEHPMDLGTIKDKLERKCYSSTHQFAADVRLTFTNAMTYNPPLNTVHMMADDLNNIFNSRWKSLEAKWRKDRPISSQQSVKKIAKNQTTNSSRVLEKAYSCNSKSVSSKSLTVAEKQKLQESLAKFSTKTCPSRLLKFLHKAGLIGQNEETINLCVDDLDEETLGELHLIVRNYGDRGYLGHAGSKGFMTEHHKDATEIGIISGCTNSVVHQTPSACVGSNHSCIDTDCLCNRHKELTQASSSDADSERSSIRQILASNSTASDLDGNNIISETKGYNISADTDGRREPTFADVENVQHPCTSHLAAEVEFSCEEQLSPSRALRAAMLKSRFAYTILKAQHRTLLNHGEKSDPARMRQERERLEKEQQEKKARIEAQVRAAEAAARIKAEADRKMQRERAREAARLALQKMEKTVDIDENIQIFKDLENLGYSQPVHLDLADEAFMNAIEQQAALANPLAQLGLFMKEDEFDEEFDQWLSSSGDGGDMEEGEINL